MNYDVTGVLTDEEKPGFFFYDFSAFGDRYWCLHCGGWYSVHDLRYLCGCPGELIEVARELKCAPPEIWVSCANPECDGSPLDFFPWDIVEDLDEAGNPFDREEWERVNYWEAEDVGA